MTSVEEIKAALYAELAAFGYAFVACGSHVDPIKTPATAISMCNYPISWQLHYSDAGYARIDAVFARARRTGLPFDWEELLNRKDVNAKQRLIFNEAAVFGISRGTTIPLAAPNGVPASCSLVPGLEAVDLLAKPAVQLIVHQSRITRSPLNYLQIHVFTQ